MRGLMDLRGMKPDSCCAFGKGRRGSAPHCVLPGVFGPEERAKTGKECLA